MKNLEYIQECLFINLSHHLHNNSGLKIQLDKKHNELTFFFDFTFNAGFTSKIFTIFTDKNTFEILPTDNHKEITPNFINNNPEAIIYHICNKLNSHLNILYP